jgi:hypothetical protein
MKLLALLPVLAALAAPPCPAEAGRGPSASAQIAPAQSDPARSAMIEGLLALAVWANEGQLFAQRDLVWRSVLALEPENAEARKGLRYARDGAGNWKEPAPRDAKDLNAALLPEFVERRTAVVAAWRTALLAALDRDHADPPRREAAFAEILKIDPDDPVIHGMRGEERVNGAWVLVETSSSLARRAALRTWIEEGRSGPPLAEAVQATPEDQALLPAWKVAFAGEGMRVLSQTSEAEVREMLQAQHTARRLLSRICGKDVAPWPGFTAFVLPEAADREKILSGIPECTEAQKKEWKSAVGFGIPGRAVVVLWDKDGKRRMDCFVRHLLASCFHSTYHIDHLQGWVVDGLGIYLTNELLGTHFTWFTPPKAGEKNALRTRLASAKTNWMAEAQKLAASDAAPHLADVLVKDLAAMKTEEMLISFAFAAYLVEGLPQLLPEYLERVGAGGNGVETLCTIAGRPLPEIEARFVRWLGERK